MQLLERAARHMREAGGIDHLELGLQALGAIGELEPIHDAGHDDVGEEKIELHLLHQDLQRDFGIGHGEHRITPVAKRGGDQLPHVILILDHQDAEAHERPRRDLRSFHNNQTGTAATEWR